MTEQSFRPVPKRPVSRTLTGSTTDPPPAPANGNGDHNTDGQSLPQRREKKRRRKGRTPWNPVASETSATGRKRETNYRKAKLTNEQILRFKRHIGGYGHDSDCS